MPRSISQRAGAAMDVPAKIPTVSFLDSVFYNLAHVIPNYLRGIFTPNKFWVGFWTAIHPDPAAVKFVSRLRRKYRSNYLYLYMLATKSLLVLDRDGIKRVLDLSPDVYADAKLKRTGMVHFQPDALTISRGEEWRERRRFNEAVLETGQGMHRYAQPFLEVIRDEAVTRVRRAGGYLVWDDFRDVFEVITTQIIFGAGIHDSAMTEELRQMMRESNRAFALKKSKYFDAFYDKVQRHRRNAGVPSLAHLCNHIPSNENTKVDHQIPHWMFAMADTLAINTARALALIVTHPDAEARVRSEMGQADLSSAQGIHSLRYLEACIQEAMRLWPTTPMLVRETVKEDVLAGATIPPKTQVIILNSFNHRDKESYPHADGFHPDEWLQSGMNYLFNHLSNGRQGCAGKDLALFIAKAALAALLAEGRYTLKGPPLDQRAPLPYAYNHFAIQFKRDDL